MINKHFAIMQLKVLLGEAAAKAKNDAEFLEILEALVAEIILTKKKFS